MPSITPLLAFYYFALASVLSGLLAVTRKSPVHSMLWVLSLFMHMAGIFVLLSAEFLAAVQVIVYAGAILIFYLFVVMLLDLPDEESRPRYGKHWPFAALGGIAFSVLALSGGVGQKASAATGVTAQPDLGSVASLGRELFGPYALPFEIASVLLLAAIIGAVVLARRRGATP